MKRVYFFDRHISGARHGYHVDRVPPRGNVRNRRETTPNPDCLARDYQSDA